MNKVKDVELCSLPPSTMTTFSPLLIFSPSLAKLGFASFGVTRTPSGIQTVRGGLRALMFSPDIQIPGDADLKDFQMSSVPLWHSGNSGI